MTNDQSMALKNVHKGLPQSPYTAISLTGGSNPRPTCETSTTCQLVKS